MFDVPDFIRWLSRQDYTGKYRYARRQLQLLAWKCPGEYWILKSPAHLFALDALLTVFPDACVVMTHRDPLRVVPSVCSLPAGMRGILTARLDLRRLGAETVEALARRSRAGASRAAPGTTRRGSSTSRMTGWSPRRSTRCATSAGTSATGSAPSTSPAPAAGWPRTRSISTASTAISSRTSDSTRRRSAHHFGGYIAMAGRARGLAVVRLEVPPFRSIGSAGDRPRPDAPSRSNPAPTAPTTQVRRSRPSRRPQA